jgi:hypothetical protein
MTETLLLALGDKVVAFLKRREEARRDEFTDVIKPVWEQVTKVHENYVSTFRAYRDLIEAESSFSESHLVFSRIAADTLYTAHLRTSLNISLVWPSDNFCRFCEAVHRYLERAGRRQDDLIEQPQERERWPAPNIARLALSQFVACRGGRIDNGAERASRPRSRYDRLSDG